MVGSIATPSSDAEGMLVGSVAVTNAGLKSYQELKESGVLWLGKVPAHWEVRRLRNVTELRVSNVDKHTKEGETPVRLCNYVDVYKNDRIRSGMPFVAATATADELERFRLRSGDVLITKDSEAWDDIGVPALVQEIDDDVVSGYHLALLRSDAGHLNGEFLYRAMQNRGVAYQFHVRANGVTRYGLSHEAIKSVRLPVPPLPEQAAIVRFLDHADRRIRRYIRAKQKLIKLLEEQKQAIIHQAVTGQINVRTGQPYPTYKDSGVEWLGKVPQHWEVRRNGRLFLQRNETGFPELPILEVSLNTGVRIRDFGNLDRKQIMAVRSEYKRAVKGDIAYNMMRMWQGAVGVIPVDGLVSPAYVVARLLKGTESQYFSTLFRTNVYMAEVDKYSHGIVRDRNRLYWEDFKQMPTSYPPPDEQGCIVRYLDKTTDDIDTAVARTRQEIDLLSEYRTRLIADVVTGKLDVRDAAAGLPEVDPLVEEDSDDTIDADMESNLDDRREVNG